MRFLETGDQARQWTCKSTHLEVKSAWTADALERKQDALETTAHGFQLSFKPFEIVTVRLEGTGKVR